MIEDLCRQIGFPLPEGAAERLDRLCSFLLKENETTNLTAVRDPEGVHERHFFDSLAPLFAGLLPEGAACGIDVGCGPGFPGLPLLIARPDLSLTFLDSTEKKCAFVRSFLQSEGLPGEVVCARAEDYGQSAGRERFDFAVSRAVTALPALCELCLPLIRVGGRLIAYKGEKAAEELEAAQRAIQTLGGQARFVVDAPSSGGAARLVVVEKVSPTPPRYPRAWAQIKKKPL